MKHIVMIDNFDSFTFNLVDYLKQTGVKVTVYRNTAPVDVIADLKPDGLVYSPGPGKPSDAGNLIAYIKEFSAQGIPQLGVCLGMQAMIEAFGGSLRVLDKPMHGKASLVKHDEKGIFAGVPNPVEVGRYHSLAADAMPDVLSVSATTEDEGEDESDSAKNEVVMAVRHNELPARGVQFHPESILTFKDKAGHQMIRNFIESI